ncbi:hypothetical protein PROPEN_04617 [Proteus penneri ATCC 35198]|nr:hypothetical protein PROPEN_04617 [Proteus penneri ATCC 35198]
MISVNTQNHSFSDNSKIILVINKFIIFSFTISNKKATLLWLFIVESATSLIKNYIQLLLIII